MSMAKKSTSILTKFDNTSASNNPYLKLSTEKHVQETFNQNPFPELR
ncbi:10863_t:CDS:2 [Cetraspora pellucida]|uniref:10863_t:CDS:1 n=1 Tax=Cetraspora pellucida TaxID=1433469 RepID=A0ACA9JYE4_9GLOM|nr:10863_t:CDS:2 [Cetraspora pellucida]